MTPRPWLAPFAVALVLPLACGSGGSGGAPGFGDGGGADGGSPVGVSTDADADADADASAPDGPTQAFVHPGLRHSTEDLSRMAAKVAAGAQPWKSGWDRLVANAHSSLDWTPNPAAMVYRGADGVHAENYAQLYNDAAAAYALALRSQTPRKSCARTVAGRHPSSCGSRT